MSDVIEHGSDPWRVPITGAIRGLFAALALVACGHGAPKGSGDRSTPAASAGGAGYVELPESAENCVELVVGTARERATLCAEIVSGYWHVTRQVVGVLRAGKSVPVLEVLTKIEGDDNGDIFLEQRLRIASDGLSATLDGVPITDVPPARKSGQPGPLEDCNHASDWQGGSIADRPRYRDLRRRSCDALGTYRWNAGRFVHQRGR